MDGTKLLIFFSLLLPLRSNAISPLVDKWKEIVRTESRNRLNIDEQSFCYVEDNGSIKGHNIDKNLGIASVSKLLTTLWAISKLGEDHQFETKVYYYDGDIHIEGGNDPVFSKRSLYFLMNQLNLASIKRIKNLTYDENFYFVPQAIDNPPHSSVFSRDGVNYCKYYEPTTNEFKPYLLKYLNSNRWSSHYTVITNSSIDSSGTQCLRLKGDSIRRDYREKADNISEISSSMDFRVSNISFRSDNPFKINGKFFPGTKVFIFKSTKLINIVKYINTHSANLPADLLFHILGGNSRFVRDISSILLTLDRSSFESFMSGSGIPYKFYKSGRWSRETNVASCKAILSILELFIKQANGVKRPIFSGFEKPIDYKHDFISKFYLAVGGIEGTVASRFENFEKSIVAKTGTLNDSSSLAGTINSTMGKKHFVLLNTFPTSAASPELIQISKNIQNLGIKNLFSFEGPQEEFNYSAAVELSKKKFYTFDPEVKTKEYK